MKRLWDFIAGVTLIEVVLYGLASIVGVIILGIIVLGLVQGFVIWEDAMIDALQRRNATS